MPWSRLSFWSVHTLAQLTGEIGWLAMMGVLSDRF
jgi:hypothetical protein